MTNKQMMNKFFSACKKAEKNYPMLSEEFLGINDKMLSKFPIKFASIQQFNYLRRKTKWNPLRIDYHPGKKGNTPGDLSISRVYYLWVYYSPDWGISWGLYPVTDELNENPVDYTPWDWDWTFHW